MKNGTMLSITRLISLFSVLVLPEQKVLDIFKFYFHEMKRVLERVLSDLRQKVLQKCLEDSTKMTLCTTCLFFPFLFYFMSLRFLFCGSSDDQQINETTGTNYQQQKKRRQLTSNLFYSCRSLSGVLDILLI